MDIETNIETRIKDDVDLFFASAESDLKIMLGDLWEKNRDGAEVWLKIVARLKWEIATGKLGDKSMIALTKKHIDFGLICYIARIKGQIRDSTLETIQNIFVSFLKIAISVGTEILKQKLGDEFSI